MSNKVDVLAEMERASVRLLDAGLHCDLNLDVARDAVAELIEAGMAATEEKMHDGASSREACERLVAALARVKGE